jgi:hypothetical protein
MGESVNNVAGVRREAGVMGGLRVWRVAVIGPGPGAR